MRRSFPALLREIRSCTICADNLPHGPRPVVQAGRQAKLLIVGQAPGRIVHETGIPWNDASGDLLRDWLGLPREVFYDERRVAIVPTGLCFPGTGKNGDLPPRRECAPRWHAPLLAAMPGIELTLLIGRYAQDFYLGENAKATLTATVAAFRDYLPLQFPLPHPSPRNRAWFKANPWFAEEVLPALRERMAQIFEESTHA
jgi:uracil-DNA glycosylase